MNFANDNLFSFEKGHALDTKIYDKWVLKDILRVYYNMLTRKFQVLLYKFLTNGKEAISEEEYSQLTKVLRSMSSRNISSKTFPADYRVDYENLRKFEICSKMPTAIKIFDDYVNRTIFDSFQAVYKYYNTSKTTEQIAKELNIPEDDAASKVYCFNKGFYHLLKLKSNTANHLVFCIKNNITLEELYGYATKLKREETKKNFLAYLSLKEQPFGEQQTRHPDGTYKNYHWDRIQTQLIKVIEAEKVAQDA